MPKSSTVRPEWKRDRSACSLPKWTNSSSFGSPSTMLTLMALNEAWIRSERNTDLAAYMGTQRIFRRMRGGWCEYTFEPTRSPELPLRVCRCCDTNGCVLDSAITLSVPCNASSASISPSLGPSVRESDLADERRRPGTGGQHHADQLLDTSGGPPAEAAVEACRLVSEGKNEGSRGRAEPPGVVEYEISRMGSKVTHSSVVSPCCGMGRNALWANKTSRVEMAPLGLHKRM